MTMAARLPTMVWRLANRARIPAGMVLACQLPKKGESSCRKKRLKVSSTTRAPSCQEGASRSGTARMQPRKRTEITRQVRMNRFLFGIRRPMTGAKSCPTTAAVVMEVIRATNEASAPRDRAKPVMTAAPTPAIWLHAPHSPWETMKARRARAVSPRESGPVRRGDGEASLTADPRTRTRRGAPPRRDVPPGGR